MAANVMPVKASDPCRPNESGAFAHVLPDLCPADGDFLNVCLEVGKLGTQLRLGLLKVFDALAQGASIGSACGGLSRCVVSIGRAAEGGDEH